MPTLDIFRDDAFGLVEMTTALERVPFLPQLLGQIGVFTPTPITTRSFAVENRDGKLSLVKTSPLGAPLEQTAAEHRNIRDFRTVRLAKGDRLNASEIQGVRAFGSESEPMQMQVEAMRRFTRLRNDLDLTLERHRLGAIQGVVLDADGQPLYDWYEAWGISRPAEISFAFNNPDADLRAEIRNVVRAMQVGAEGGWTPGTSAACLCGDEFFDKLVNHPSIKETKLGSDRAALLENIPGYSSKDIENVAFINYRGTDDGSSIAIGSKKAKFFPIGSTAFQHVMSPGESFGAANTPGLPFYALTIPDDKRDMYVDFELYSYPAMVCERPKMLQRAKAA